MSRLETALFPQAVSSLNFPRHARVTRLCPGRAEAELKPGVRGGRQRGRAAWAAAAAAPGLSPAPAAWPGCPHVSAGEREELQRAAAPHEIRVTNTRKYGKETRREFC